MKNRRTPIAAAAVAMALLCALPAAAQAAGSAYVTAAGPGTGPRPGLVDQYTIASGNGVLSPKNPFTAPTGDVPGLIAVTPDGKSVYVGNGNDANVSQYYVDAASGRLSPKNPQPCAAGVGP